MSAFGLSISELILAAAALYALCGAFFWLLEEGCFGPLLILAALVVGVIELVRWAA